MAALERAGAILVPLDLTDDASIVAAVETLRVRAGRFDVLVNNAGYGSYGALEDVPLDEGRRQCEVNLFGLARLCQLALPMMRAQTSGRIINITSIGGKMHEPFGAWYHATKFAVEGLSDCLRVEVKPFGIDVIVIEPGAIRTEWTGIAKDSLLDRSGMTAYAPYARRHAAMFAQMDTSTMVSPRASSPPLLPRPRVRSVRARAMRWAAGPADLVATPVAVRPHVRPADVAHLAIGPTRLRGMPRRRSGLVGSKIRPFLPDLGYTRQVPHEKL